MDVTTRSHKAGVSLNVIIKNGRNRCKSKGFSSWQVYKNKDVLKDQELTGGHSQYVLRHFQENERPSYPGLNINKYFHYS